MDPPTQAPPVAPPAPLRRRASRRLVAGVAGGLADYYRTRPIWLRIGFLLSGIYTVVLLSSVSTDPFHRLTLSDFGLGIIVTVVALAGTATYLLVWWYVPREDLAESAVERLTRRYPSARRWPGIAVLGVGLAILLDGLGVWRANVVIAAGLIAAGVLLYRRDGTERRPTPSADRVELSSPTTGVPTPVTPTSTARLNVGSRPAGDLPPPVARMLPPRERSALGWTTIGIALLVVGGAALWTSRTDATPRLVTIPALALLVLSAGLLVGTVYGRARWLALPALLLVPVVLLSSAIRLPLEGRFGDLSLYPTRDGMLNGAYISTAGKIFIDLTRLQGQHNVIPLQASTVFGDVTIVVPYDAHVVATGYAGYGTVSLLRESGTGVGVSERTTSEPRYGDGIRLTLDLEAGIGNVSVVRTSPTRKQIRAERREERRS